MSPVSTPAGTREPVPGLETTSTVVERIAEMSMAMQALRQARDGVMERCAEVTEKLRATEDRLEEALERQELIRLERDATMELLSEAQSECRSLQEQLAVAAQAKTGEPSAALIEKARAVVAAAEARENQVKDRQKITVADLAEQFAEERRKWTKALEDEKTRWDIQVNALKAQLALHAQAAAAVGELERSKLEIAKLKGELAAAQDELTAGRQVEADPEPVPASEPLPTDAQLSVALEAMGLPSVDLGEVRSELAAIDWHLEEIRKDPAHLQAIDVLASIFRDISQRALATQWMAVHRVASASADVAAWVRQAPGKIMTGIPLLQEGRALIRQLLESGTAAKIADPAGAHVYAVDNDPDNCECISMALEKAHFQTRYATTPGSAYAALSKGPVDLIVLDVDLGETDGFTLHDLIRATDHHTETPVVFVSGLLSAGERIKTLSGPPASFVAKPYNLNELVLKAMGTIVSSRMRRAENQEGGEDGGEKVERREALPEEKK